MKLYDEVQLLKDYGNIKKGSKGIIVELFDDKDAFIELIDKNGVTYNTLSCVSLSDIKKIDEN